MTEFNFWFLAWGMWYMYKPYSGLETITKLIIIGICLFKMATTW